MRCNPIENEHVWICDADPPDDLLCECGEVEYIELVHLKENGDELSKMWQDD